MKYLIIIYFLTLGARQENNSILKPSYGKIVRFENFKSKYIHPRNVDVWLPENYSSEKKYSVLYMHDGQMLFDSIKTWNKQEWKVDETISILNRNGSIKECIVVGIWNNNDYRFTEYFPQKALGYLEKDVRGNLIKKQLKGEPLADKYLLFITQELKPFIDNTFNTYSDPLNTSIMGSSMGGLISIYAICEYPQIFGSAACLSTHWIGNSKSKNPSIPKAFNSYLYENLPNPLTHRIYFDYGTKTLDSLYKPYQSMIDETMKVKGYNETNWKTIEFAGDDHSERSWSRRLDIPLLFLLRNK